MHMYKLKTFTIVICKLTYILAMEHNRIIYTNFLKKWKLILT